MSIFLYGWIYRSGTVLSFEISGETETIGQVYWSTGAGFSEMEKSVFHVAPHRKPVKLVLPQNLDQIRIDPLINVGHFSLGKIQIGSRYCIFLPERFCYQKLRINGAVSTSQISRDGTLSQDHFLSTGNDPHLQWAIERRGGHVELYRNLVVLFIQSLLLTFTLVAAYHKLNCGESKQRSAVVECLRNAPLLCVPYIVAYTYSLVSTGATTSEVIDTLFLTSLLIFVSSLLGIAERFRNRLTPKCLFGAFLVFGFLAPDFHFHLGMTPRPFAGKELTEYHWRLGRDFEENFQNSALKYIDDLNKMDQVTSGNAVVFSDVATSYYLSSTTEMRGRVFHPHHTVDGYSVDTSQRVKICDYIVHSFQSNEDSLLTLPNEINYVLVNKDQGNKNIVALCPEITEYVLLKQALQSNGRMAFSSEFFELYEIN